MPILSRVAILPFILLAACTSSPSTDTAAQPDASLDAALAADAGADTAPSVQDAGPIDASGIVADRPYTLRVPSVVDPSTPMPLLVMFHGYGASGATEELGVFQIAPTANAHGFLYAYGDGTLDSMGKRFWNATDACCDKEHAAPDDVAYFDAIVDDVSSKYSVDPKRIYVIGHSNGAFMAHRLACDRASRIAAIVSFAGAVYEDPSLCNPSVPVPVAEVHGDADQTILYDGGQTDQATYPSAHQTVATWAAKDGCSGAFAATGTTLDLVTTLAGNETVVEAYGGCPSGVDVQLWTIQGGVHIPAFQHPGWAEAVWSFMSAHTR